MDEKQKHIKRLSPRRNTEKNNSISSCCCCQRPSSISTDLTTLSTVMHGEPYCSSTTNESFSNDQHLMYNQDILPKTKLNRKRPIQDDHFIPEHHQHVKRTRFKL